MTPAANSVLWAIFAVTGTIWFIVDIAAHLGG